MPSPSPLRNSDIIYECPLWQIFVQCTVNYCISDLQCLHCNFTVYIYSALHSSSIVVLQCLSRVVLTALHCSVVCHALEAVLPELLVVHR